MLSTLRHTADQAAADLAQVEAVPGRLAAAAAVPAAVAAHRPI
ncbi:hypothetical protein [Kitasatospora sp. NPDC004272]